MNEEMYTPSFGLAEGTGGDQLVDRNMAFICSKGNLDMAYPALIMANAALGEGASVHIFFTFWGLDMVTKQTMDSLKFTMVGNTAMHMPFLEKIRPGWGKRYIPHSLGMLPGMTHFATKYMNRELEKLQVPSVRDMLEQIEALGGQLWACKMTADMMNIKPSQLHSSINAIISATDFIEMTDGSQIIFI